MCLYSTCVQCPQRLEVSDPLTLALETVVSPTMCALGVEPRSLWGIACTLNYCAFFPALGSGF